MMIIVAVIAAFLSGICVPFLFLIVVGTYMAPPDSELESH